MRQTHCMCDPLQDMSNGSRGNGYPHAEPRGAEAYLKQYVEATRGEPAQLTDFSASLSACRSGESAVAAEAFMNNAG